MNERQIINNGDPDSAGHLSEVLCRRPESSESKAEKYRMSESESS